MTFTAAKLAEQIKSLEEIAGRPRRFVVAYSGGLDSTVMLHAVAALQANADVAILAIHIDHGLQADSAAWQKHCSLFAAALGVGFQSLNVNVQADAGKGPEAAARDARYSALGAALQSGDWLLSAHHRDDQAETLLLNLIRGSGPAGVAGIGDIRRFGPGWLVRPMLDVDRSDLLAYATLHKLPWVEDPTNTDRRYDRNFLRHEILPALASRWPDIAVRLQRSAGHAGEASQLLVELAELDLKALGSRPQRMAINELLKLSPGRQRNVIRYALRTLGLSTPTASQLERVLNEVIPARVDAQPLVSWPGAAVRRYRNGLYLMPMELADAIAAADIVGEEHELGAGLGRLQLQPENGPGVSQALVDAGLSVRPREGGEEIQLSAETPTRKLKKLLQEEGIVPWMRNRLPLLYSGEQLVAVGDLWIAAAARAEPGVAVRWIDRPALH